MTSLKLSPETGAPSAPQRITLSSYKTADTKRRAFYAPETASSVRHSRGNKVCAGCGRPKGGRGLICQDCYHAARNSDVTLSCTFCGASFTRPSYQYEKALRRGHTDTYCTKACSQAHHAIKNAKQCAHCQQPMPGRAENKFCSPQCRKASQTRRVLPDRQCPCCGMSFAPISSRQTYCDRMCADAAHSERMRGSGNSHFKDGTSYTKWFVLMRPLIMERDGHCCVVCGKDEETSTVQWRGQEVTKTNLRIHHVNEKVADNTAENLVTLCKTCHAVHHKSKTTPWPWFAMYARGASQSMTSRWRGVTTSLQKAYLSITA